MGPLIDAGAVRQFESAVQQAVSAGGRLLTGGKAIDRPGYFVQPTIVQSQAQMAICQEEIFAPILHVFRVKDLEEAVALNNAVAELVKRTAANQRKMTRFQGPGEPAPPK